MTHNEIPLNGFPDTIKTIQFTQSMLQQYTFSIKQYVDVGIGLWSWRTAAVTREEELTFASWRLLPLSIISILHLETEIVESSSHFPALNSHLSEGQFTLRESRSHTHFCKGWCEIQNCHKDVNYPYSQNPPDTGSVHNLGQKPKFVKHFTKHWCVA